MKNPGSPAVQQFQKESSRAFARLFDEFVLSRGLDVDDQFWSEQDRAEFAVKYSALVAERQRKAEELWAAEDAQREKGN